MSGTYEIDNAVFPDDPLQKRWMPNRIATRGNRRPIYSAVWRFEMSFGNRVIDPFVAFFEQRFLNNSEYIALLPHPFNGQMVSFTGVVVESCDYDINDMERSTWANNLRVTLSLNIAATGSSG